MIWFKERANIIIQALGGGLFGYGLSGARFHSRDSWSDNMQLIIGLGLFLFIFGLMSEISKK